MLKLRGINLVGTDKQAIPGLPGNQGILRTNAGQPAPKMRNMGPQCDIRARGRRPAPQRIGDAGRRYALIQIDQQQRKQLTLLAPAKLEPLSPVDTGGQRTQDAKPRFPGPGAPPSSTRSAYSQRLHSGVLLLRSPKFLSRRYWTYVQMGVVVVGTVAYRYRYLGVPPRRNDIG